MGELPSKEELKILGTNVQEIENKKNNKMVGTMAKIDDSVKKKV